MLCSWISVKKWTHNSKVFMIFLSNTLRIFCTMQGGIEQDVEEYFTKVTLSLEINNTHSHIFLKFGESHCGFLEYILWIMCAFNSLSVAPLSTSTWCSSPENIYEKLQSELKSTDIPSHILSCNTMRNLEIIKRRHPIYFLSQSECNPRECSRFHAP